MTHMKKLDKLMKSGRLDKIWSGIDTEFKPWEWSTSIYMIPSLCLCSIVLLSLVF
jgi:hypothetical protein